MHGPSIRQERPPAARLVGPGHLMDGQGDTMMTSTTKLLAAAATIAFAFGGAAQAQDGGQPGPAPQANDRAHEQHGPDDPAGPPESQGIGPEVRDIAREPDREAGGIGGEVRDLAPGRAEPAPEPEPEPEDDEPEDEDPDTETEA
jgi:hypothetical protein